MKGIKSIVEGKYGFFALGVAAAMAVPKLLKTKCARDTAVTIVAKCIKVQDDTITGFERIKEEAQDIVHEAKEIV